jgi:hypothetical protein
MNGNRIIKPKEEEEEEEEEGKGKDKVVPMLELSTTP